MKMAKGGLISNKFDPDRVPCLVQSGYFVPRSAISKYGLKFLNTLNKGAPMQTISVPNKIDDVDRTRIDSCEECSNFAEDNSGFLFCTHTDSVVNVINPVTYTYAIPAYCPLEDWYCGCRHPECTDCYPRDTRIKHGLKDHEMAALVNAVRDAVQPHTKLQCTREIVSKAVSRYLEDNDLRIDKREW